MRPTRLLGTTAIACALAAGAHADGHGWGIAEAAEPFAGTAIDVVFLLRPGYGAMLPAFEEETGTEVDIVEHPHENALGEQARDVVSGGDLDVALIDAVWMGNFAENERVFPVKEIEAQFPEIMDRELDLGDFFPLVPNAFGG